jgi:hypothetical protein
MLATAGFVKTFFGLFACFGFGRISVVVRLRAFIGSPFLLPEKLRQAMCQPTLTMSAGTPD